MKITINPTFDIETNKLIAHDGQFEYNGPMELAIRAATKMAAQAGKEATQSGKNYSAQASDIGSTLVPELKKEATHPTGFDPGDLNSMLVAGQQGSGGALSSVAGEAGLQAARSRNSAGTSGILDEAARAKTRADSSSALDVQGKNAMLKESQKQAGLAGLSKERGTDVHADLEAQGLVPQDIKAWADANNSGWLQNMNATITAIGQGAGGAGKLIHG